MKNYNLTILACLAFSAAYAPLAFAQMEDAPSSITDQGASNQATTELENSASNKPRVLAFKGNAHIFESRRKLPESGSSRGGEEAIVAGQPMNKIAVKKGGAIFDGDVIETEDNASLTFVFPAGDRWRVDPNSRVEFSATGGAFTVLLGRVNFSEGPNSRSTTVIKGGQRYFRSHFVGDFVQVDTYGNVTTGSNSNDSAAAKNTPITSKQLIDEQGNEVREYDRKPLPDYDLPMPSTDKILEMNQLKLVLNKVVTYRSDKLLGNGWPISGSALYWLWPWGAIDASGDVFPFVKSNDSKGIQTYARWNWSAGFRLSSIDMKPLRFYLTPQIGAVKMKGVFNVGETKNGNPVTSSFGGNPRAFMGFKLGASLALSQLILDTYLNFMLRYSSDRVTQNFYYIQSELDFPVTHSAQYGVLLLGLVFRYEDFSWAQSFDTSNSRSLNLNWTQFGFGASWRY